MVCPLRIIVITVSVVVAITLALIALLSGDDDVTKDWQRCETDDCEGNGTGVTGNDGVNTTAGSTEQSKQDEKGKALCPDSDRNGQTSN